MDLLLTAVLAFGGVQLPATEGPCGTFSVPPRAEWPPQLEDGEFTGIRELALEVDLDGDGEPDVLRAEDSSGSTFGLTAVEVQFAGGSEPVTVDYEYAYVSFVDLTSIPEALRAAAPCALAAVERILFHHPLVEQPDPSLAWLLDPSAGLRWIDGPPVLPEMYTWRDEREGRWVTYGGHNHAYEPGVGELPPRVLAAGGERVLLGTRHGVILTDPSRSRHAWLYVFPGGHKLRWRSVVGARLEGGEAVVELELREGLPRAAEVRIDLATGDLIAEP